LEFTNVCTVFNFRPLIKDTITVAIVPNKPNKPIQKASDISSPLLHPLSNLGVDRGRHRIIEGPTRRRGTREIRDDWRRFHGGAFPSSRGIPRRDRRRDIGIRR
jgi:hypothetical protein